MGGIPTTVHGQVLRDNTTTSSWPVRGRRMRVCRCTAPTARHQLAAGHHRLAAARASPPPSTPTTTTFVDLPDNSGRHGGGLGQDILSEHGNERVADIRTALQQSMDGQRRGVPHRGDASKQALTDIHALKERYSRITVHDKGKRCNSDLLEAIELGFRLNWPRHCRRCAFNRRNPAAATLARLPNRDDTKLHAPHHGVQGRPRISADIRLTTSPWSRLAEPMERKYRMSALSSTNQKPATAPPVPEGAVMVTSRSPGSTREPVTPRAGRASGQGVRPRTGCSTCCSTRQGLPGRHADLPVVPAHGVCDPDAMRINGVNRLACKVLMRDLLPKKPGKQLTITIEPIRGPPWRRIFVVNMEPFDAHRAVNKPFLITSGNPPTNAERIQSATDRARFDDTNKCIPARAALTSCPVY